MNGQQSFYLCPRCFNASETPDECHDHPMIRVEPGEPGDERRKPLTAQDGQLSSRAPRWFLEVVQSSLAPRPYQPVPA